MNCIPTYFGVFLLLIKKKTVINSARIKAEEDTDRTPSLSSALAFVLYVVYGRFEI